jgi:hypothetical protein
MCDGAVNFINEAIAYGGMGGAFTQANPQNGYNSNTIRLYQRLGIRNDGNVVGGF